MQAGRRHDGATSRGTITLDGKGHRIQVRPADAIEAGIVYVPEDRGPARRRDRACRSFRT